jgi:cytidylate kinase
VKKRVEVTITGEVGSGKSTVAHVIARALRAQGFTYVTLAGADDPDWHEQKVAALGDKVAVEIQVHQLQREARST